MLLGMAFSNDMTGPQPPAGGIVDQYGNLINSGHNPPMDLPYEDTFAAIIQGASNSFMRGLWDEALRHSRENALAMKRDCSIQGWMRERKEGTVSRKWQLTCPDETDPVQVAVRDGMKKVFEAIPHFKRILRWALESTWYGRYGVQFLWKEVEMDLPKVPVQGLFPLGNDRQSLLQKHLSGGGQLQTGKDGKTAEPKPQTERRKIIMPVQSRPVNGDKINFLFTGEPLVAIYAGFEGNNVRELRKQGADVRQAAGLKTEITWDNLSPCLVLTPGQWRERFLISIHDPDDSDYFDAEHAGAVGGVGCRSRIYWWWWQLPGLCGMGHRPLRPRRNGLRNCEIRGRERQSPGCG